MKRTLEIAQLTIGIANIFHLRFKEIQHYPAGLLKAAVEINSTDNGFERIHQQSLFCPAAGFFFASSELQVLAQVDSFCVFHEIRRADKESFQLRQLPFRQTGMRPEKKIADEKSQDCVAQKFQLLVVALPGILLIRMGAVRQCLLQQIGVVELIRQFEFQIRQSFHKNKGLGTQSQALILLRRLFVTVRSSARRWQCSRPCPASTCS